MLEAVTIIMGSVGSQAGLYPLEGVPSKWSNALISITEYFLQKCHVAALAKNCTALAYIYNVRAAVAAAMWVVSRDAPSDTLASAISPDHLFPQSNIINCPADRKLGC